MDAAFRFARVDYLAPTPREDLSGEDLLGKRCWEIDREILAPGGWAAQQARLEAHQPFRDVVLYRAMPGGTSYYVSISGVPKYAAGGEFAGYRGIGRDVTEQKQREKDLTQFRAAIDASPDPVYLTDPEALQFHYVNDAGWRNSGYTREELLQMGPQALLLASPEELRRSYDAVIAAGDAGIVTEIPARGKDGRRTVVEVRRRALKLDGKYMIVSISRNQAQRILAERAIRRLTRMFAALSSTNEAIMHVKSAQELYQRVCDAAVDGGKFLTAAVLLTRDDSDTFDVAAVTGAISERVRRTCMSTDPDSPEGRGLAGTAIREQVTCVSNDFANDPRTKRWHASAAAAGIKSGAAVPLMRGDQAVGLLLLYSGEKRTFDSEVLTLLGRMAENIVFALDRFELEAERRRAEERARYLATHDALTGLPNRVMFSEMLNVAIESARRYKRQFAVLFIDLDRFKVINDTLGHEAGDVLLKEMSTRLTACLRGSDVIARLGGDEFVVLVQEVTESHEVATVARKILSAAIRPVSVLAQECRVTASVGISMFPGDAEDEKSLMKNADIAMYLAKEEGKNNYQFYSTGIKAQSLERLAIETQLRRAMELNELSLHYQAKVDLESKRISGVEALLRWQNEQLGAVTPIQFIPVAEETGLIVPIGRWVLRTACAQNVEWQRQGLPPLCMAVNLSPRQFTDPDLVNHVREALDETGMAAEQLELEITESMVMHNAERAVEVLTAIKAMGVRLAVDDFGTGYSSLSQLKRFPIDTLKVDRSFIRTLPLDTEERVITEAIIALGRSLSLTIVAEGVETEEQQSYLREHHCDQMQGFYFSKPLAPADFADLMREHGKPS
jgi:diguanylate cyclase (GGDEF)-like protein/PAS domain S-box-containing protein